MALYSVRFFTGDYGRRQQDANAAGAVCYAEQHFNAADSPQANYALAVAAANASETSKVWGRGYTAAVAREFGIRDNGVSVVGTGGRGYANLTCSPKGVPQGK